MVAVAAAVLSLVALVAGQGNPASVYPLTPPPLTWFVEPILKADVKPAVRGKACHDLTGTSEKDKEMSLGPVILAEDQEPQIYIFFPPIPVLADLGTNCVPSRLQVPSSSPTLYAPN